MGSPGKNFGVPRLQRLTLRDPRLGSSRVLWKGGATFFSSISLLPGRFLHVSVQFKKFVRGVGRGGVEGILVHMAEGFERPKMIFVSTR